MKKFFQYLIIILLFSVWGIIFKNKVEVNKQAVKIGNKIQEFTGLGLPCSKPIEYSIGIIDPRFNIDEASFLKIIDEAQNIWSGQLERKVFFYNPKASFKINLIFDDRQIQSNETDELETNLEQLKLSQNKINNQYDALSISYNKALASYNSSVAKYENQLKQYNKDVEKWNESDKTSQNDLDDLQKERKDLDIFYDKLQKEQAEVNELAKKANALASQEKKVVDDYNSNVSTYKEKYGTAQEFEKGVNAGTEINIYQFRQVADLRMTLIHELGHSLGMGHVENPKSIMYYLMGDQNMEKLTFSNEDIAELERVCKIK
ncbi:MAG: matrixin family metalloprotease [Candidatus Moraniibacteriota bacterium]